MNATHSEEKWGVLLTGDGRQPRWCILDAKAGTPTDRASAAYYGTKRLAKAIQAFLKLSYPNLTYVVLPYNERLTHS